MTSLTFCRRPRFIRATSRRKDPVCLTVLRPPCLSLMPPRCLLNTIKATPGLLIGCQTAACCAVADDGDCVDVTAGNVSPWHAAKPAVFTLGDACDAAAVHEGSVQFSPMSDDRAAGGSMSPDSDGGGFLAPPPLLYEPSSLVPWGHGAPAVWGMPHGRSTTQGSRSAPECLQRSDTDD